MEEHILDILMLVIVLGLSVGLLQVMVSEMVTPIIDENTYDKSIQKPVGEFTSDVQYNMEARDLILTFAIATPDAGNFSVLVNKSANHSLLININNEYKSNKSNYLSKIFRSGSQKEYLGVQSSGDSAVTYHYGKITSSTDGWIYNIEE